MIKDLKCEECGGDVLFDGKEYYCSRCGLIQKIVPFSLDHIKKKIRKENEENLLHDRGYGRGLQEYIVEVLHRSQSFCKLYKEKTRLEREIELISSSLNLPRYIKDTAIALIKCFKDKNSKNTNIVACSMIYAACLLHRYPLLPHDFSEFVERQDYPYVVKIAGEVLKKKGIFRQPTYIGEYYIEAICRRLNLINILPHCKSVYYKLINTSLKNASPRTVAFMAIYIVLKQSKALNIRPLLGEISRLLELSSQSVIKHTKNFQRLSQELWSDSQKAIGR